MYSLIIKGSMTLTQHLALDGKTLILNIFIDLTCIKHGYVLKMAEYRYFFPARLCLPWHQKIKYVTKEQTHRNRIQTILQTGIGHVMYGETSEGGCPLEWRPEQLGVWYLAHGHLGSAQEVNWHLSSYQPTLHIDLNQQTSGSQAKSPRTELLPPHNKHNSTNCQVQWVP